MTYITIEKDKIEQVIQWAEKHGEIVFAGGGMDAVDSMNVFVESLRRSVAKAEKQEPVAWKDMAFTRLGAVRDKMHPDDVATVQRFLNGDYTHQQPEAEEQEPVVEADLCVMVGYSKANGGYFVYEETTPQEFCAIKGPFTSRLEAEKAMRDPNAELIKPQPAQPKPLTDEQIGDIAALFYPRWQGHEGFARAIEAAHGIKENT